ncbi:MAG: hypothetical protein ACFFE5_01365 [Candidatus Thorarchaeota archaeon]
MTDIPSLTIWSLAWVFLIIGLISLTILVIYTKYGREISIKLSIINAVISAIFLAFALHFLLLSWGL